MSKVRKNIRILFNLTAVALVLGATHAHADHSRAKAACTGAEEWGFSKTIGKNWRRDFRLFLKNKMVPSLAYAQAVALEKTGGGDEIKSLARYWQARVLFKRKFFHAALDLYNELGALPYSPETIGIQIAAIECVNQIHWLHPRLHHDQQVERRLPVLIQKIEGLAWKKRAAQTIQYAASILVRVKISDAGPEDEIQTLLGMLRDSGANGHLARGLWSAKKGEHFDVISEMENFLKARPPLKKLDRYKDTSRLILARAYYQVRDFKKASEYFQAVSKDSNHMIRVITELAWVHLMLDQYDEAVGAALNLQKGGLRQTFSPDGIMVLAIAFNELCQFPSALQGVRFFHKTYKPTFNWLANNKKSNLFQPLLTYVRTGKTSIPRTIISEWLRSPIFITHQEELNLVLDEGNVIKNFRKEQGEQLKLYRDQIKDLQADVNERLKEAKAEGKSGKELPVTLIQDQNKLKYLKTVYGRLRQSKPEFMGIVTEFERNARRTEKVLAERVEADLKLRNDRMLQKLQAVAENIYLLKIEIYNGASQDIVWQKANPEYKEFAENLKDKMEAGRADQVLNWGKGTTEVWIDELGGLKAHLYNNCDSKDKYVNVVYGEDPI